MWAYTTKMTLEGHSNCFVSSKLTTYRATKQTIVHSNICVDTKPVQNPKHDKTLKQQMKEGKSWLHVISSKASSLFRRRTDSCDVERQGRHAHKKDGGGLRQY